MKEFDSTVITYNKWKMPMQRATNEKGLIKNIFSNTSSVYIPHPHKTLRITTTNNDYFCNKKTGFHSLKKINQNNKFLPKFYLNEYHHLIRAIIFCSILFFICLGLSVWALVLIFSNSQINNWVSLFLIIPFVFCCFVLVKSIIGYINFYSEAKSIDFSHEKTITINIQKAYKKLKTAHIDINWICGLIYTLSFLGILIDFLVAWGWTNCSIWGNLDPIIFAKFGSKEPNHVFRVFLIIFIVFLFVTFFFHLFSLISNYVRSNRIDNFYNIQIVSDEELNAIKKRKNKRNMIIFLFLTMILVLLGILIYKLIKSHRTNNTVTINS